MSFFYWFARHAAHERQTECHSAVEIRNISTAYRDMFGYRNQCWGVLRFALFFAWLDKFFAAPYRDSFGKAKSFRCFI